MGRTKLPVGSYGAIGLYEMPNPPKGGKQRYRARVQYRALNGRTVPVQRYGQTKSEATRRLRAHLVDVQAKDRAALISSDMTVAQLADVWRDVERPHWSTNTRERYELELRGHIIPELGSLLVVELKRSVVSAALRRIMAASGPAAAKSSKSVLSGMCKLAMIHDLLDSNPARDTVKITAARKEKVRALTRAEVDALSDGMASDLRAQAPSTENPAGLDLADLVEFMLGTGCRIGEACAARLSALDMEAGTWEINATAVRVKGIGMTIQERPKTAAGWRVLALPPYCAELIARRRGEDRLGRVEDLGLLFGAPFAKTIRDPSNTAADLRAMLDRLGFPWVTSHVFRKTVATRLDEAGMSARAIADQLGHSRPSMTTDVYMGRNVVSAEAARILNR